MRSTGTHLAMGGASRETPRSPQKWGWEVGLFMLDTWTPHRLQKVLMGTEGATCYKGEEAPNAKYRNKRRRRFLCYAVRCTGAEDLKVSGYPKTLTDAQWEFQKHRLSSHWNPFPLYWRQRAPMPETRLGGRSIRYPSATRAGYILRALALGLLWLYFLVFWG